MILALIPVSILAGLLGSFSAYAMTGSWFVTFLVYSASGMAVLFAVLIAGAIKSDEKTRAAPATRTRSKAINQVVS